MSASWLFLLAATVPVVASLLWVNGSLMGEKLEIVRQAQVERADYKSCAAELAALRSRRARPW